MLEPGVRVTWREFFRESRSANPVGVVETMPKGPDDVVRVAWGTDNGRKVVQDVASRELVRVSL